LIIDNHKKKKDESLESLEADAPTLARTETPRWDAVIDAKDMLRRVSELDEPYKTTFELRYLNELSPKEIAETLGEPVNVISVRIHRAKKMFLRLVTQHTL